MRLNIILESEDDVAEPNFFFTYEGKEYPAWSSSKGRMKTAEYDLAKFNRFAKIGQRAEELRNDLKSIVRKDPESIDGRCAYACVLMMDHGIRSGNESSAEGYVSGLEDNEGDLVKTYGVSTLLNDHVRFQDNILYLHFLGKTQVEHKIKMLDPFAVKWGQFYYKNQNNYDTWIGIDYYELYKFVRDTLGKGFIPKDFRTFCGNLAAWDYIRDRLDKKVEMVSDANDIIRDMVEHTAAILGNTPGVTRSSYLDSRMLDWIKDDLVKEKEE